MVSAVMPARIVLGGPGADVGTGAGPLHEVRSSNRVQRVLDEVHARVGALRDGEVATYIPALGRADPDWFGLSLVTARGRVYTAGDAAVPFTIQSVSKPFVYALALAEHGWPQVQTRVGVEPDGGAFNAVGIEADTGRPHNPMINAGAIVIASMFAGPDSGDGAERLLAGLSAFAGRDLCVDETVLASEAATADMNRALGYLLRRSGALSGDVEQALAAYFRQCSVLVTATDLAVMAATLAAGGVNPITGRRVVDEQTASHVLAVMTTCGMYDYSGEWFHRVGLPAKSGVAGGLCATLPGRLGIGVFSPPLDRRGNSVRGIAACSRLSAELGLHLMSRHSSPVPDFLPAGRHSGAHAANA